MGNSPKKSFLAAYCAVYVYVHMCLMIHNVNLSLLDKACYQVTVNPLSQASQCK